MVNTLSFVISFSKRNNIAHYLSCFGGLYFFLAANSFFSTDVCEHEWGSANQFVPGSGCCVSCPICLNALD